MKPNSATLIALGAALYVPSLHSYVSLLTLFRAAARPQDGHPPGAGGPGGLDLPKGDLTCPAAGGQAVLQLACPSGPPGGPKSGDAKPSGAPPGGKPTETVYLDGAPTVTVTATNTPGIDCSGCSSVSVAKPTCSGGNGPEGGHSHPPADETVTADTKTITEPAAPTCTA